MKKSFFTISCSIGIAAIISSCSNSGPTQVSSVAGESKNVAYFYSKTLQSTGPTNPSSPAMAASLAYPGNLEVVRRTSSVDQLEALYWLPGLSTWYVSGTFASNVYDDPAMCVSRADNLLQVVVRESTNYYQLRHYWRDNSGTWYSSGFFGSNCGRSPTMISNIQSPYNLELLVQSDNQIKHMYRDQNFVWHETGYLPTGGYDFTYASISLTQTPDGLLHAAAIGGNSNGYYLVYWVRNSSLVWEIKGTAIAGAGRVQITALSDNGVEIMYKERQEGANSSGFDFLYAPQSTHIPSFDGWMTANNQEYLSAAGMTTLNGNEIHVSVFTGTTSQHWKLLH